MNTRRILTDFIELLIKSESEITGLIACVNVTRRRKMIQEIESLISPGMLRNYRRAVLGVRLSRNRYEFVWPNGSTLRLLVLSPATTGKLRGYRFDVQFVDESIQFTPELLQLVESFKK